MEMMSNDLAVRGRIKNNFTKFLIHPQLPLSTIRYANRLVMFHWKAVPFVFRPGKLSKFIRERARTREKSAGKSNRKAT